MLVGCAFPRVVRGPGNVEVIAFVFKENPGECMRKLLDIW